MAIHTFAAIYIGSYEVSLKIFEISARKNIRKIDYIRSRIELGRDAYSRGVIGYELVEALCDTLEQFTKIMKGSQPFLLMLINPHWNWALSSQLLIRPN